MEFRIPRMELRIPRVAPRIPRNSPRAPRIALFTQRAFFLKLGWSPGFRFDNFEPDPWSTIIDVRSVGEIWQSCLNSACREMGLGLRLSAPELASPFASDSSLQTRVSRMEFFSGKPRIRKGCASRNTFSQAPRKLLLVDFGRKEYGYGTSWRGFNSFPGTHLNSTLGFAWIFRSVNQFPKNPHFGLCLTFRVVFVLQGFFLETLRKYPLKQA